MKGTVVSANLVHVDLEYQSKGLSEKNVRDLIRLLERSVFRMREIGRTEPKCCEPPGLFPVR